MLSLGGDYYDVRLGRYLTRGDEANAYEAATNNPISDGGGFFSSRTVGDVLAGTLGARFGGVVGGAAGVGAFEALYTYAEGNTPSYSLRQGVIAGGASYIGGRVLGSTFTGIAAKAPVIVHLTDEQGSAGISATQKIGSKWGIFGLAGRVPSSGIGKQLLTGRNNGIQIAITGAATRLFRAPLPIGPISLARNLAGVRFTPLGSLDLQTGELISGEIFADGTFRPANGTEILRYWAHQGLVNLVPDSLLYGGAYTYYRLDKYASE